MRTIILLLSLEEGRYYYLQSNRTFLQAVIWNILDQKCDYDYDYHHSRCYCYCRRYHPFLRFSVDSQHPRWRLSCIV